MIKQPKKSTQTNQLNLPNLFQSVARTMAAERTNLNTADTYNHDHGDNMVEVFNVITQAMQAKRNASPADQLLYASQLLRQKQSGSAQLYSQGLSQASQEFKGQKQVTPDNAITLIQALLGGGKPAQTAPQSGMGDLLGTLLGGGLSRLSSSKVSQAWATCWGPCSEAAQPPLSSRRAAWVTCWAHCSGAAQRRPRGSRRITVLMLATC